MTIIIDTREHKLKSVFDSKQTIYSSKQLNLGDIIIEKDNIPIYLFERKTLDDLLSSIVDGRYENQSIRLDSSNIPNKHIFYILEGNIQTYTSNRNLNYINQILYIVAFIVLYLKKDLMY